MLCDAHADIERVKGRALTRRRASGRSAEHAFNGSRRRVWDSMGGH